MRLDAILQALLAHDNAARQQAERELKKLARQPEALLQLLEAAQGSTSAQVCSKTSNACSATDVKLCPTQPRLSSCHGTYSSRLQMQMYIPLM